MFKIVNDNEIYLTRGDKALIDFSIEDYTFNSGDRVKFSIYNKKKLDEDPVFTKTVDVNEECESITIELTSEETKIGELSNKIQLYWYEIELNGEQTVLGYDDNGPKLIRILPEGKDNGE